MKILEGKHQETLEKINHARIFNIEHDPDDINDVWMIEQCDEYFAIALTPELCNDLSEMFKILSEKLKINSK